MKTLKSVLCVLSAAILLFGLASCSVVPTDTSSASSVEEDDGPSFTEPNAGEGDDPEEEYGPSITVFTEFPTGVVTKNRVNVTYEVTPGSGSAIEKIYYTINGDFLTGLYYVGNPVASPHGELDKGFVILIPGIMENHVVFTVVDSSGRTAQFEVENTPIYEPIRYEPDYDDDKKIPIEGKEGHYYISNNLNIYALEDALYEDIERAVSSIDGIIMGYDSRWDRYYIQIPDSTLPEIEALCDYLESNYRDIIESAYSIIFFPVYPDIDTSTTNSQGDSKQWALIHAPDTKDVILGGHPR